MEYKRWTVKNWREEKHTKAYDRLAELEDKIEQGTLKEIPENAVVFIPTKERYALLSKEEYEELQKGIKTYKYTAMFDAQDAYRWEQGYLQGRKETAEKFAERLKEAFLGVNCIDIDEWNWYQDKIDEICKEITEGK